MQYPGQVNKIAAGSAFIIMNFEPKMGCDLHKMGVGLPQVVKCVLKIHFMKLVTMVSFVLRKLATALLFVLKVF